MIIKNNTDFWLLLKPDNGEPTTDINEGVHVSFFDFVIKLGVNHSGSSSGKLSIEGQQTLI